MGGSKSTEKRRQLARGKEPPSSACVRVHVPTLRANQHQWQVPWVSVGGEAAEVVVNGLETDLVLQAEDEDDGIDPQRKLQIHKHSDKTLYIS